MYTEVETERYTHKTYNVINRYDLSLKKNHKQPKNEGEKGYTCRPRKKNQKRLSLVLDIPRVYAFSPKLTTFHTHDTNYTSMCITSKSLSL